MASSDSTTLAFHPAANIFPMLGDEELHSLAHDIGQHGQREPIMLHPDGSILDGRNRYRACLLIRKDPVFATWDGNGSEVEYVVSLNLQRRHLNESQRAMVATKIATLSHGGDRGKMPKGILPQKQAAKQLNVSVHSVQRARTVIERGTPELVKSVEQGKVTVSRAIKEIHKTDHVVALKKAQSSVTDARKNHLDTVCDLRVCSCAALFASGVKPDAVITDPPYPREFLPVFSELAEACAKAKVPLVAVMSGQSYLPEVMRRLCEHLVYRWTLAYLTPGGQAVQQWEAKVNAAWKPVLVFGAALEWFGDVASSSVNDNDKRFHGWGQSESGMADLVERLTKPGQLICDPFLGGGTTAVVSLELGRRFVGCDIDSAAVETARTRVEAMPCQT